MLLDLLRRRLVAILDGDEEEFRSVFANDQYEERDMGAMDLVTVLDPTLNTFDVLEVFVDDSSCIAVSGLHGAVGAVEGGGPGAATDYVIEYSGRVWGLSWIGSGWRCDGPHPFSG